LQKKGQLFRKLFRNPQSQFACGFRFLNPTAIDSLRFYRFGLGFYVRAALWPASLTHYQLRCVCVCVCIAGFLGIWLGSADEVDRLDQTDRLVASSRQITQIVFPTRSYHFTSHSFE